MHFKSAPSLRAIRVLHTVVWAILAGIVVAIPIYAWRRQFTVFVVLTGIVLVEVGVLASNSMKCPLTVVAERYTDDRRDNFDIYLPLVVARYNKQIFGSLFVAGLLMGLFRWLA